MKSQTHPLKAQVFQWVVIIIGTCVWSLGLAKLCAQTDPKAWREIAFIGLAVFVISLKPVYITTPSMLFKHKRQLSISLSDALIFLLLVVHGPYAALFFGGIDGLVASYRTVKRWQSNVFTLGMIALSILATAKTYESMMGAQGFSPYNGLNNPPFRLILPLFIGVTVHFLVNSVLLAMIIAFRYRRTVWQQLRDNHLWMAVTYYPPVMVTVIFYICMQRFGWFSVAATIPVLYLIYISYTQYNQKVEEKMRKIEEINDLNLMTVKTLALAIDARSGSSPRHAERVKIYAQGLAKHLHLPELETQALQAGALLRDVGMLAIPDHILTKPGQLTSAEFERMKMHTSIGAEILGQIKFPYPVVPIVLHHHERWNGEGYPNGLQGEEIPLGARILAVADCFDAAREKRNYREALTLDEAVAWLRGRAGTHFDPQIVEAFIANLPEFEAEIAALAQQENAAPTTQQELSSDTAKAQTGDAPSTSYTQSLEKISGVHLESVKLYKLAQTVGRSLSLRETLSLLLERLRELVPSTTSAVFLKHKQTETLHVAHAHGQHAAALVNRSVALHEGNVGAVFTKCKPIFNTHPALDFLALKVVTEATYHASLYIPLVKENDVLGVLALYSAEIEKYSSEDIRLLEAVAQLAGDAIANALHYEEAEATAYTDRLTGLPNLRAILRAFDMQNEVTTRTGQPYTLVMMDLDGFKTINDTLGHTVGDCFLIEISQQIKSQLRASDFLGRYGGDEFVAIFPHTRAHEIEKTVTRIKAVVDEYVYHTEDGRKAQGGVSIGVAECDASIGTLQDLMTLADTAMYRDKAERKARKAAQQEKIMKPRTATHLG